MVIIIAKNQTGSPIVLEDLSVLGSVLPAAPAAVTLTDTNSVSAIRNDIQLLALVTAGDVLLNDGSGDLNQANSLLYLEQASILDATAVSGDVVGPGAAVDDNVAFFDGTTGKLLKDSGLTISGTNTGDEPDATTTVKGVVELATDGEAIANVVVQGNDARLSDARIPTGAATGDLSGTYPSPTVNDGADGTAIHRNLSGEIAAIATKATPTGADLLVIEDASAANAKKSITLASLPHPPAGGQTDTVAGANGVTNSGDNINAVLEPVYGAVANTVTEGNDVRLSDARTPTSHAASHQDGGSDEVATATPAAAAIPKADGSGTLDSWVSAASETVPGIMETATVVEVNTGTDSARAVSPSSLAGSTLASDVATNNAKITNQTHTGEVTGATALTITSDAVTNAKLADVPTATLKGRVTAATGDPEDLTGTQATTLLDQFTSVLQGVVPGSGGGTANFLRADGTWNAPPAGAGEVNTASNVSTAGVGVFKQKTGVDLEFRGVNAASSKVTVVLDAANNEIDVDVVDASTAQAGAIEIATQAEVDAGTSTTLAVTPDTLANATTVILNGQAAGGDLGGTHPNPTVNDGADSTAIHDDTAGEIAAVAEKVAPVNADLLLIEDSADLNNKKRVQIGNLPGSGEANTASNVNTTGVGVFDQKTGVDLEFRGVVAGSSKASVVLDAPNSEIEVDVVEANIVHQNLSGAGTNTHAQIDTHIADTSNPHATDVGNLGSGTLAELNAAITDATLDDAGDPRTDTNAIHSNVSGEVASVAVKATPVAADLLLIEDSAAANAKKQITIGSLPSSGGLSSIDTGNTIWVDAVNGNDGTGTSGRQDLPYLTVGSALTAASSGDTVIVRPGTYAEEGLTIPSGVALRGHGGWQTTFIGFTAGRTADLLTLADDVTIQGLTLYVSASASHSAVVYSGGGGSNTAAMYEIRFLGDGLTGAGIGIDKSGPGKIIGAEVRFDLGGIGVGMQSSSGAIALEGIHYPPGAGTFTTAAKVTGTGRLQLADFNVGNSNITDTFECGGTGTVLVFGVNITGATNAVHMTSDGTFVGLYGGKMSPTSLDFLLDNIAWTDATTVQVTTAHQGLYSFPASGLSVNFELAHFSEGNGTAPAQFTVFGPEVSFGFPEKGTQFHTGRGRSYVSGISVWTTDSTAGPGSDGAALTDVTTVAQSLAGSTFTFQGLPAASVGTSILFASFRIDSAGVQLPYWGIQLLQSVAGVGGSYVIEVRTGASTWAEVGVQAVATQSDYRYGADLFLRGGSEEDLRFGVFGGAANPELPDGTAWPATTIVGAGTGRWARIRITSAPTTFPTFDRLAISPSHCEFNAEGERVAHGLALWRRTISAGGNIFGESGGVVQADEPVGSGGLPTGWTHVAPNAELNQSGDAIYYQFALQDGLCTAYPVSLAVIFTTDGSQPVTAAPQGIMSFLPSQVSNVKVADPAGGFDPVFRSIANTESLTGKVAQTDTQDLIGGATLPDTIDGKALCTLFGPFDISGYYEDDMIFVRFELDSDGTPAQDIRVFSLIISAVAFSEGAPI